MSQSKQRAEPRAQGELRQGQERSGTRFHPCNSNQEDAQTVISKLFLPRWLNRDINQNKNKHVIRILSPCVLLDKKKDKEIQNKQAKEERELRGYYIYIKVKPAANHVAVFNTKVQKINRSSEKHHVSVYCACIHTQRLQSHDSTVLSIKRDVLLCLRLCNGQKKIRSCLRGPEPVCAQPLCTLRSSHLRCSRCTLRWNKNQRIRQIYDL